LLGINQVYYRCLFYKAHKHYNYLQNYLIEKLFTKVINMPSLRAWKKRPVGLIKRGRKLSALRGSASIKIENVT
jgi:hypothetical protein